MPSSQTRPLQQPWTPCHHCIEPLAKAIGQGHCILWLYVQNIGYYRHLHWYPWHLFILAHIDWPSSGHLINSQPGASRGLQRSVRDVAGGKDSYPSTAEGDMRSLCAESWNLEGETQRLNPFDIECHWVKELDEMHVYRFLIANILHYKDVLCHIFEHLIFYLFVRFSG